MNGFVIKYQDISDILWEYKEQLETLIENITTAQKCVGNFIDNAEFTGKTADAIRSYLSDVHMTLLSSLQTAAQSMLDNIAVYKGGYYEIDGSANFVLSEEVMEEFRTKMVSKYDATEICGDQIENVLVSISDLFTASKLDKNQVPEIHEKMDYDIIQLKEAITSHESMMVQALENSTEPLIHLLESSINRAGSNTADVGDYESGKFYANTDVNMLMKLSQYLDVRHENNKETYDEIWDAEKQIKAEEEANDGIWETIAGVGLVIAGGVCIVATAGAATPIVVAGGIAGGGTMLFGMSDATEGIQHIYYGKTGDVSSIAMNPLRDSVFNGNDKAYRITENVFEFSSSALPIAGMASKAGKTVLDMGAKGAKSAKGKSISEIAKGGKSAKTIPQQLTQKGKIPAIGKMKDLNTLGNVSVEEFKIADYLPDLGKPQANWHQNSGILRSVMNERLPIKDVSMFPMDNAGFLGAERNLLQSRGWTYLKGYWYPPK